MARTRSQTIDILRTENVRLRGENACFRGRYEQIRAECNELSAKNVMQVSQIDALTTELKECKDATVARDITLANLQKIVEELEKKICALGAENAELKIELGCVDENEPKEMKSWLSGIQSYRDGMDSRQPEIDSLKSEIHSQKSEIDSLKSEIHSYIQETDAQKRAIASRDEQIAKLRDEVDKLDRRLEASRDSYVDAQQGLDKLHDETVELRRSTNELERLGLRRAEELGVCETRIRNLERKIRAVEDENAEMKEELDDAKTRCEELTEQRTNLVADKNFSNIRIEELERKIRAVEDENAELKKELDEADKDANKNDKQTESLVETVASLKKEIESKDATIVASEEKIRALEAKVVVKTDTINCLMAQCLNMATLEEKIRVLETDAFNHTTIIRQLMMTNPDVATLKNIVAETKDANTALFDSLRIVERQRDELLVRIETMTSEHNTLVHQMRLVCEERDKLKENVIASQIQHKNDDDNTKLRNIIIELQQECNRIACEAERRLKFERDRMFETLDAHVNEISRLKAVLEYTDDAFLAVRDERDSLLTKLKQQIDYTVEVQETLWEETQDDAHVNEILRLNVLDAHMNEIEHLKAIIRYNDYEREATRECVVCLREKLKQQIDYTVEVQETFWEETRDDEDVSHSEDEEGWEKE